PFVRARARSLVIFIATIGVAIIIQNVLLAVFTGTNVVYVLPQAVPHRVGPFLWTSRDELIMAAAAGTMALLHLLLRYTKFGKALRAVADSRDLARVSGIDASRVIQLTWGLAGLIAGLGGFVLAGRVGSFAPSFGFNFLLVTFAAAIVGGIGKPYGAMAGALLVGVAMETSAFYVAADYKLPIAFALLIATLLVRPEGLFTTTPRKLRGDYFAITTLATALIMQAVISNDARIFAGYNGLYGLSQPFNSVLRLNPHVYPVFYLAFCLAVLIAVYLFLERLFWSPFGRALRSVREDETAAAAFGRNVFALKLKGYVIGGVIAGLGGALFVHFLGAFNVSAWSPVE